VYAAYVDGSLWDLYSSGGGWYGLLISGRGFVSAGGQITAMKRDSWDDEVYLASVNGDIWRIWEDDTNGDVYYAYSITSQNFMPPGSSVAAARRYSPQRDVFCVADDGTLWTLWSDDEATWYGAPLSLPGFAPAGAGVTGLMRDVLQEDAFTVANDGAAWTDFETNNSAWSPPISLSHILGMPFNINIGLPNSMNTMELASLYDPDGGGGLFFASVGPTLEQGFAPLQFNLSCSEVDGFWIANLAPNQAAALPGLAIGVNHTGDWHPAVDYYVANNQSTWTLPIVPAWFREAGAIYSFSGAGAGGIYMAYPAIDLIDDIGSFNNLPQLLTEAQALGTNVVYLWDYYEKSALTPQVPAYFNKGDYIPRSDMGGATALKSGVAALHRAGGKIIFYVEPFIIYKDSMIGQSPQVSVDLSSTGWTNVSYYAGLTPPDQNGLSDLYAQYPANPNIPGDVGAYSMVAPSPDWQQQVINIATRLVQDYHADGIFLDSWGWQLNWPMIMAGDPNQTLYSPLEYSQGVLTLAARVRAAVQAINRNAVVLGETTSGQLWQVWDGGLSADFAWMNDTNQGRLLASPARYGVPQINYFSNGTNLNQMQQVYAAGYSLALCSNNAASPDSFIKDNAPYIKQLVQFRKQYKDALIYGQQAYMPATGSEDVAAYFYQGSKNEVITLVNTSASQSYSGSLALRATEANTAWMDVLTTQAFVTQGQSLPVTADPVTLRVLVRVPSISLAVTLQSITRNSVTGVYTVQLSVTNTGYFTAPASKIARATLGAASTSTRLPYPLGDLAPGATSSATLSFPRTAGTAGSTVTLKVAGAYTGGTFSSIQRIRLP